MVLEIALALLFLSEHKLRVEPLNLESFVNVQGHWRFWDVQSLTRFGTMKEIANTLYVSPTQRNEIIAGQVGIFKTELRELSIGALCVEYLVGEDVDEELVEYLGEAKYEELPDVLKCVVDFSIEWQSSKEMQTFKDNVIRLLVELQGVTNKPDKQQKLQRTYRLY